MSNRLWVVLVTLMMALGTSQNVFAYSNYLTDPKPNGFNATYPSASASLKACILCHTSSSGGSRNKYGSDFSSSSVGNHSFNAALEGRDSDGDTFSNIAEINAGTFPGNASSKPATPPPPPPPPPGDTTAPAVTITTPTSGTTYSTGSSSLSIGGSASDVAGVTQVTWSNSRGGSGTASGTTSWSASGITLLSGSNVITVSARDAAGNTGTDTLTVTYTAPPASDTAPPTVSIASPSGGTVSGSITVTATASDNVAVVGVQFKLDGANLGAEDTASPYSVSWNTSAAANSTHTLTAVARDAAGNTTTSSAVTVTVSNVAPPPPPPPPGAEEGMEMWSGRWFKVTLQNEGYYVEGLGLSSDRHSVPGYLNIEEWDPEGKVFGATLHLYDRDTGKWYTTPMPLHYSSGTDLDLQVWSQVTGTTTYGFTARIKGKKSKRVLNSATFKTIGGYHVTDMDDDEGDDDEGGGRDEGGGSASGWLKISGKMVPDSKVPVR
jgi:hypothetical protein